MRWSSGYSHFTDISSDTLMCKFIGRGGVSDVGGVITNVPLEENVRVAYFEVTILHCAPRCSINVGLADRSHSLNKVLGSDANSFGYRGEDGKVISEGKRPETFAVNFGLNDVVGCGIDYTKSVVFYTKNGIHLGSAGSIGSTRYFPAVSMSSPGESIQANFGTSPFHFDIPEYVSSVIEEEVAQISRMSVPVDAHELVASYLDFAGYSESAAALPTSYPSATLSFRSLLRTLIMSGNVGKAISLIEDSFNEILCGYTFVFLYSQNVFELVLNRDTLNACCFMKEHLSKYRNDTATDIIELLAETCGLFCYDEPDLSGIQLRREKLWRHVNRIVLSPSQEWDPIEMLVREIVASKTLTRTRGIVPSAKAVCAGPVRTRIHTEKCDKLV